MSSRTRRLATAAVVLVLVVVVGLGWRVARKHLRPAIAAPDAATLAQARRVRILRDRWGVPHVFGQSDGDTAFGLAYANAEDDFPTVQLSLAAARGQLGLILLSKDAIINDYYQQLVDVDGEVAREYDQLAPATRELCESYARGLNYYAYKHPDEVDSRLLPYRGRDVAAGFAHKLPLMLDLPGVLRALDGAEPKAVGDRLALAPREASRFPGSNSHAVAAWRSTDGRTRLNINSHQPWEGPVTWYEAQLVSQEGWNMTGGLFPGSPVILHGHNQHLGWAHTVNSPDLVDVYKLDMNPEHGDEYRFEGGWKKLEVVSAPLRIDIGLFDITLHKDVLRSVHGPVFQTKHGYYAIRYVGAERRVRAVEQWYRMNKAASLAEWKAAMQMLAIPMFNTTYADYDNIYYVYNALFPKRKSGVDYKAILPGDRAALVWSEYEPYDKLPQILNPPSGFVQNCNSPPFFATSGDGDPRPADFPAEDGIETVPNNRTLRSLALFGGTSKISGDDFVRFKFDRTYARGSAMFTQAIDPLLTHFSPLTDDERRAVALLREWDGVADEGSTAATLAVLIWQPMTREVGRPEVLDPIASLREAVQFLRKHYGRIDVPLGTVQRLRRGAVDLPLGGGPDVLNAAYTRGAGEHLIGFQGDSYVLVAAFAKDGVSSQSIHQYGESNRPRSPHYADQAPLFVKRQLKPALRGEAEIRAQLEREYSPGD
jgi:penicillin amidase/acyl-homoserine-lactone acylase